MKLDSLSERVDDDRSAKQMLCKGVMFDFNAHKIAGQTNADRMLVPVVITGGCSTGVQPVPGNVN